MEPDWLSLAAEYNLNLSDKQNTNIFDIAELIAGPLESLQVIAQHRQPFTFGSDTVYIYRYIYIYIYICLVATELIKIDDDMMTL